VPTCGQFLHAFEINRLVVGVRDLERFPSGRWGPQKSPVDKCQDGLTDAGVAGLDATVGCSAVRGMDGVLVRGEDRVEGSAAKRSISWIVAAALAIIGLSVFMNAKGSDERLLVENGFIGNEQFAVVGRRSSSDTLYLSRLDGSRQVEVESAGVIQDPTIDSAGRVLFVERVSASTPNFRILQIESHGETVSCRVIAQSEKYIGSLIAPDGPLLGSLILFTGEFNPNAVGISVKKQALTILLSGKISTIEGRTFLSVGRPAQFSDSSFVAVEAKKDFSVGNALVKLELTGGSLMATPLEVDRAFVGDPWSVTSDRETGTILVTSLNYATGTPKEFITEVKIPTMTVLAVHELPGDRLFSGIFSVKKAQSVSMRIAISTSRRVASGRRTITVSRFEFGEIRDVASFPLNPPLRFSTNMCVGEPLVF
jgi:hypothetical protein